MNADRFAIHDLLAEYGALLDMAQYDEWLGLFAAECRYNVVPRENFEQGLPVGLIFCDSRAMLEDRVMALREANKYNIHNDRHLIGLPRLVGADGLAIEAPFAVYQTDQEGGHTCSRPASTATAWSAEPAASKSVTSSSCSTPSRCRRCSRPRCESDELVQRGDLCGIDPAPVEPLQFVELSSRRTRL